MPDNHKKKILEKPVLVFLLTFLGLAALLTILAMFNTTSLPLVIGTYFLFGGAIIGLMGFIFLNKGSGDQWDGYNQSQHIKNNNYFKKVRQQEKPVERVVWAIIFAALSLAAAGYFFNIYFTG